MPIKCRIFWDDLTQTYVMSSKYASTLIEGLKLVIPSGSRDWDEQAKLWRVSEAYGEVIRKVAETCFGVGSISFISKQTAEQSQRQRQQYQMPLQQPSQSVDTAILEFFGLLSYEAARRSYLVTCQTLHPDKEGGDPQKMSRLNELWTRLEKEFFKR